ncbi:hypothetical protein EG834_22520 [bacterium]|nr:hypothetical protein [bacterium]
MDWIIHFPPAQAKIRSLNRLTRAPRSLKLRDSNSTHPGRLNMDQKAGAQIGKKAFIQSFVILLLLMLAAGILTQVIPAGAYQRTIQDGRTVIDTQSFQYISKPNYPAWRWITAPFEVLWGPDAMVVDTIIVFILIVSGAFAVLDKSGILTSALGKIVKKYSGRKYVLLLLIIFFFMLLVALL